LNAKEPKKINMKIFNKPVNQNKFLNLPIEDRLAIVSLEKFNSPYTNYLFN